MRLRRIKKRTIEVNPEETLEATESSFDNDITVKSKEEVKLAKPAKESNTPMRVIRKILDNPNFSFQLMVIILTLASENVQMDRRIEGMTTTVDRVRSIAEVINNTMQSVKVAAEAPKTIRRLLE